MINLNINSEDHSKNDFLMIWDIFKTRPNQLVIHNSYDYMNFTKVVDMTNINVISELIPLIDDYSVNDRILSSINEELYLSYVVLDSSDDKSIITDITFFYKELSNIDYLYNIIDNLEPFLVDDVLESDTNGNLNLLNVSNSNLTIEKIDFEELEFKKFYSKSTNKNINNLIKSIKNSKNGLSIFYGEKGTGKTNSIKNISKIIKNDIFFIPNNILDQTILNSEFISFLKKYDNSILVIDDFELALDNYSRYDSVINNIIQMVDSLISEVINVNIILIFNTDNQSEIEDLIECNNILGFIKFDYLSVDESNQLSEYLGSKTKYKNNSKLSDIIRNKNTNYKKRVGF
jgi:hypothetical protein